MDERLSIRLRWSLGAIAAVGLAAAAAAAIVVAGNFDTSTREFSQPVSWLIHRTMIDSVIHHAAEVGSPPAFGPADVRRGLALYRQRCEVCHGGPGVARQGWVAGMSPSPPYLVDAARQWRPRELYFIISRGVKMSAMPAWSPTLSPGDMWAVVAFLEKLPTMSPRDYAAGAASGQPP